MAKIKISDLKKDVKVSKDEMKKVLGGVPFGAPVAFNPSVAQPIADQMQKGTMDGSPDGVKVLLA